MKLTTPFLRSLLGRESKGAPCISCPHNSAPSPQRERPVSFIQAGLELKDLLQTLDGLRLFQEFLKSELSEENLHFWILSVAYSKSPTRHTRDYLFRTYICRGSRKSLNISCSVQRLITARVQAGDLSPDLFHQARVEVYALMEHEPFRRFLTQTTDPAITELLSNLTDKASQNKSMSFSATSFETVAVGLLYDEFILTGKAHSEPATPSDLSPHGFSSVAARSTIATSQPSNAAARTRSSPVGARLNGRMDTIDSEAVVPRKRGLISFMRRSKSMHAQATDVRTDFAWERSSAASTLFDDSKRTTPPPSPSPLARSMRLSNVKGRATHIQPSEKSGDLALSMSVDGIIALRHTVSHLRSTRSLALVVSAGDVSCA